MEMKTIHGRMLLIVTVWTRLHLLLGQPTCWNPEYIDGSDFQRNVIQVLESLSGNASTSGFNTSSVERQNSNSAVYGFIQCRGDLNSPDCKACASMAKEILVKECHTTSGFIYKDACFLRYDNHSFYNDYDEKYVFPTICNNIVSNQPDRFANITLEALSKLLKKIVPKQTFFATEKYETDYADVPEIYGLAQCWNYVSPTNCQSFLAAGPSILSEGCRTGALGGRYLSMYCLLRYESYSFFNTSIMPSPPLPPPPKESPPVYGSKRSNLVGIIAGVLAATVGLVTFISLWKWNIFSRRNPWKRISRSGGEGGEIDLSPSVANPELIFKYDILKEAASNFNEENKLGEGGFGSVFKSYIARNRSPNPPESSRATFR